MKRIAAFHACAFTVLNLKRLIVVTSLRSWKNVKMSWVFHLMKMKLTEDTALESPFWIRNGKRKLGQ